MKIYSFRYTSSIIRYNSVAALRASVSDCSRGPITENIQTLCPSISIICENLILSSRMWRKITHNKDAIDISLVLFVVIHKKRTSVEADNIYYIECQVVPASEDTKCSTFVHTTPLSTKYFFFIASENRQAKREIIFFVIYCRLYSHLSPFLLKFTTIQR